MRIALGGYSANYARLPTYLLTIKNIGEKDYECN